MTKKSTYSFTFVAVDPKDEGSVEIAKQMSELASWMWDTDYDGIRSKVEREIRQKAKDELLRAIDSKILSVGQFSALWGSYSEKDRDTP